MGVSASLRQFAFARPTAFAVNGWGGDEPFRRIVRDGLVEPARAPHDSDLLLLGGRIPEAWTEPLRTLFETFALPRLVVWLRPDPDAPPPGLPHLVLDPERPDRDALLRRLLDTGAPDNHPILPDEPPTPWRGEGDHGQGGEGMMGGTPYGRPMAMVGNDPDGLMLGALPTSLGPFFPGLPGGLQLKLTLQGERISSVDEVVNWFPETPAADADARPALRAALGHHVPAADLERERIRSHLRTMAAMLDLAGLEGVARRFLTAETTEPRRLERLFRAAERRGLRRVLQGVGTIGTDLAEDLDLADLVARASGVEQDARTDDPAYREAGFTPVVRREGDAWARWCVLRDDCLQSAELLPRLGERTTTAAEGPHGRWRKDGDEVTPPSRANLTALDKVLPNLLWPDALITIASLGLDMEEAAVR